MLLSAEEVTVLQRGVVALAMLSPEAASEAAQRLPVDAVSHERLKPVWSAIRELVSEGETVDLLTVQSRLANTGSLDRAGGISALTDLVANVPYLSQEAPRVVQELLRRYELHKVRSVGYTLANLEGSSPDEILGAAESALDQVRTVFGGGAGQSTPVSTIVDDAMLNVWGQGAVNGYTFGVRELDKSFRGLRPGELTVVAARTSMGKTFVALHMARRVAVDYEQPVLIATLEMSRAKVVARMFGSLAMMDHSKLEYPEEWSRVPHERTDEALQALRNAPLWITDKHRTTAQIRAEAGRIKAKNDGRLGLVVVDYLELLQDEMLSEKRDHLGLMVTRLRNMAIDLECPVVLVHQLNRGPDGRRIKKPQLSDLRDSGHVENAADIVLLLYRPGYYDARKPQGEMEVYMAKQRDSDVGMAKVHLERKYGLITDLEHDTEFEGQDVPF